MGIEENNHLFNYVGVIFVLLLVVIMVTILYLDVLLGVDIVYCVSLQAFLTRVADKPVGARELTSINAVNYLSQCGFIDMRPSHHSNSHYGDYVTQSSHGFIPSILERYRQLLFPLLKFLFALLTCPGPHHKEVVGQVTALIGAHSDVFAAVLKEDFSSLTCSCLHELALITGLIALSGVGTYVHVHVPIMGVVMG